MHALNLPETQRADVRSAYVIAEDLALRQIENEFDLPLLRHRTFEGISFDGVAIKDNHFFCAEILFLVEPNLSEDRIEVLFNKADYAAEHVRQFNPEIKLELLLVLITQLAPVEENALRKKIAKRMKTSLNDVVRQVALFDKTEKQKSVPPVDFNIYFYDFENLQNTFLNQ